MNLIIGTYHSCERREYAFIVLKEYYIITQAIFGYSIPFPLVPLNWSLLYTFLNSTILLCLTFLILIFVCCIHTLLYTFLNSTDLLCFIFPNFTLSYISNFNICILNTYSSLYLFKFYCFTLLYLSLVFISICI